MTAELIRDLGHIRWADSLAWMERMDGTQWKQTLAEEKAHWKRCVDSPEVQARILPFFHRIRSLYEYQSAPFFLAGRGEIAIGILGTGSYSWRWVSASSSSPMTDVCADLEALPGGHLWTVSDVGKGGESYELSYMQREKGILWSHRGVGPFVCLLANRVYSIEAKNTLVYWRVVSWNAKTGEDYQIHYTEKNPTVNLSLHKSSAKTLFFVRESGGFHQLWSLSAGGSKPRAHSPDLLSNSSGETRSFVLGDTSAGWFQWEEKGGWQKKGVLDAWKTPSMRFWNPEYFSLRRGILILCSYGERAIWKISKGSVPKQIWRGVATCRVDPWDGSYIQILQPGRDVVWWNSGAGAASSIPSVDWMSPIRSYRTQTVSQDGTHVPYILVQNENVSKEKRGLLVIGYAAYGIPTGLSLIRWQPLLDRGWTICIGLFRGGGDHSPAWAQQARRSGRSKVLEDAEAVVVSAQNDTRIPAGRTVLYGRSAGGLWVGGLCARHPKGTLAGGAYMEVPYLDVLRTSSNPSLPLTQLETNEFGRADLSMSDFASILKWSPMEGLTERGIPGIRQLLRTAENDSEVFAYEPVKWVLRSRGLQTRAKSSVVLAFEEKEGHFSSGWKGVEQNATDLAVLDSWMDKTQLGAAK